MDETMKRWSTVFLAAALPPGGTAASMAVDSNLEDSRQLAVDHINGATSRARLVGTAMRSAVGRLRSQAQA